MRIIPAILSGGAGKRLWPASTEALPKQFHALGGARRTLFQETVLRVSGAHGDLVFLPPVVICGVRHADLVAAQLNEINIGANAIAVEPEGRNTAAAAVVAAALAQELAPGALVLLAPADHLIGDAPAFHAALARGAKHAGERIVTFGVAPARAETGYGYIERGAELGDGVYAIAKFHEKPDAVVAAGYLRSETIFWNTGLFLCDPSVLLEEFSAAPDIRDGALAALAGGVRTGALIALDAERFCAVPSASLDVAVMQKTERGAVAPCAIGWADLGSWQEVWRQSAKDARGNAATGDVRFADAGGNIAYSDGPHVAVLGVHDLIIVASGGVVLVAPRSAAQDVKSLATDTSSPPDRTGV